MAHTLSNNRIYRMRIEEHYDPQRPSWAETSTVFFWDHPQTKAGYLTRHFFSKKINVNETIPAWTYDTIQSYGYDSSAWSMSNPPPITGPVPNTQGVYFGQRNLFGKGLIEGYNIADIDVLRFWPVGRPGAQGGLEAFAIGGDGDDDTIFADAGSIITNGPLYTDSSSWTLIYKEAWLYGRKNRAKTLPSYTDYYGSENYIYPPLPEIGYWNQPRDIGITSWTWTTYSASNMYVEFTDSWYQNRSSSNAPGTFTNPLIYTNTHTSAPYADDCSYTHEITSRQKGNSELTSAPATNSTGINLTSETGIVWDPLFNIEGVETSIYINYCDDGTDLDNDQKMLLADQIWGGNYYEGGFYIENRGLAYHLANAVKWNELSSMTQPFIGNLTDPTLYGSYGRDEDGNYGPIPPLMNFNGGGEQTWQSNPSWKDTEPYASYLDWDTEYNNLEQYYSNTSEYIVCSFVDYPNNSWVKVYKPAELLVDNAQNERICPEYNKGDIILATQKESSDIWEFIDLNSEGRQKINYSTRGTLIPYHDYFPNPYIPFETSFLIPSGQQIPPYSFNCSKYTYSNEIHRDSEGTQGAKGDQGDSAAGFEGSKGEKGSSGEQGGKGEPLDGNPGDQGEKGEKGGEGPAGDTGLTGGTGPKGEVGNKGQQGFDGAKGEKGGVGAQGESPPGDAGESIITGSSWGTVNGDPSNYTTSTNGTMEIQLGDAAHTEGNESTTIQFSRKHFGVCVENTSDQPTYKGIYIYASDFID